MMVARMYLITFLTAFWFQAANAQEYGLQLTVNGLQQSAPVVDTRMDVELTGLIERTTVTQSFTNTSSHWAEGVYTFPLPERVVVDKLEMRVGTRLIIGEIQEKQQARQSYARAKAAGQRTSLVEQARPNVFKTSLANIPPGETIEVAIGYQQLLSFEDERMTLRLPSVV
ncbi:MAG: VIT domain-containing protein, partial [Pseudomonadota bacterium]